MHSSKFKVSRRIGHTVWFHKKLTPKQKAVVWKLATKSNRKLSDFARQLQNYTKVSLFYGNIAIKQTQHNHIYTYLDKHKSLLLHMETRLDVILVRANFCSTLYTARQLITHGKLMVNGNQVTFAAFMVSVGDIIAISQNGSQFVSMSCKHNLQFQRISRVKPSHLEINYKTLTIILVYEPSKIQFPYKIEFELI
jgi:small subunit ribosomal protein S4